MRFTRHEPPKIGGKRIPFSKDEMEKIGAVMDHYAYVFEAQVRFKEEYYGYKGAVEGWKRLQSNTHWPAQLKHFFPWVKDEATGMTLC